jgi:hypothetical protein
MARIQGHHIRYTPKEWKVDLHMLWHRAISRIQITRATPEAYMYVTNFLHAVATEWNRMREELDTKQDLRVVTTKKKRSKLPERRKKK